ncbi:hypothetical protein BCR34DRAFT_626749 [Clohesyomyces aquaticus]|uniref:Letm1 RBD domain-containing protein n=1 Tax=Clohesyomyces aquaticus TaxID=1231657 RepID=A0A1Y1Z6Y9_9PLEO|nr:hypothetical protein BCR34DRAFT_626749 [Clohesyomyces aquaticus]
MSYAGSMQPILNSCSTGIYGFDISVGKIASTSLRTQSNVNSALNPPEETYAPELRVPSRAPGQNYFGYLFRCGKAYIAFYKTGIKRVRSTAKLAKSLRRKDSSSPGGSVLTRAEWQIVRRSRKDLIRLLPFGVLVLVLGEWMPLIAAWITPVVPEACRIPMQVDKALRKKEERRHERLRRVGLDAARLIQKDRKPGSGLSSQSRLGKGVQQGVGHVRVKDLEKMGTWDLVNLSARLDAHSRVWDWMFVYPPKGILRWGVKRKLEYLERDDGLIGRDGGWERLSGVEVRRACEERGIYVLGKSEKDMGRELGMWFQGRGNGGVGNSKRER